MSVKKHYPIGIIAITTITLFSCNSQNKNGASLQSEKNNTKDTTIVLKDYGNKPTVLDIESYTLNNNNFRTVLWTGSNLQVTLMSIPVGGDIGLELHPNIDQFLRIEEGEGRVMMGDAEDNLDFVQTVKADNAVFVSAGKWHNIVNTGDKPLKLYSIYAPAEHPHGTIHKTQAEAIEAEHHH
ncbi:cupin domain-containing protein [Coprobacter tertius]|uniref:Cupin domain-containing protein n=1 Tax=Coprobacter tertius TaxID=2944915 RepID=A0ABT1MP21_9BACT|nr:cupin domain-containing protein [Coprobacter tertius]MCP9613041.1 cupin domain-containing protein [Coprobacter tertius]